MADPILAGISRGLQQLPVNDANRPVIRREPEGFRPGPVQPAGAGIRPAPGARRAALAPAATDLPMRRMAQPAAGAAVRAPEPPPIPQRLADLMRQETGRAQIAAAERPAVPGSGDSRGSERTDRVVPEPGAARPVGMANVAAIPAAAAPVTAVPVAQATAAPTVTGGGTFQVEPVAADVAFTAAAEPAQNAPSAALANQVRQAAAVQDLLAATAAPQPAQEGGIGMAKRPRVIIDQIV